MPYGGLLFRNEWLKDAVRRRMDPPELFDCLVSRARGFVVESAVVCDGGPVGEDVVPGGRGREGNDSVLSGGPMTSVLITSGVDCRVEVVAAGSRGYGDVQRLAGIAQHEVCETYREYACFSLQLLPHCWGG